MTIYWKNFLLILSLLSLICITALILLPLNPHSKSIIEIISASKSRLFLYLIIILFCSGLISYIISNIIKNLISRTTTDLIGIFKADVASDSSYLPTGNLNIEQSLSSLKTGLNQTRQQYSNHLKKLNSDNDRLLILINAINEGIAVIKQNGIISTSNNQFEKIFEISTSPKGRPYWEVLRINEITEIIESALQKKQSVFKEICIIHPLEKYYFINIISPESSTDDIIAIFFDITEFKNLERIKADLIANVSHELRTPLTAIKGYVETIEDGAYDTPEEKLRFLNIIKKHTDRLINIVSDLLILSEIENKENKYTVEGSKKSFETVSINNILNSCYDSFKQKIKDKNIIFEKNMSELPQTSGNAFLLEQAFLNLIDNSIKYTPDGGKVGVRTMRDNNHLNIEIFDTGIGIPKESIPRIFERFYRVDKDRSRKEGGTGLGLSIVKHVINLHDGDIMVESELSVGTKFTIQLPLKNNV